MKKKTKQYRKKSFFNRKLFSTGLRDPVHPIHRLLLDPDLHPVKHDRHHLMGLILDQQRRDARSSRSWGDHRAHHDHLDDVDERGASQGLLRQIHRRLPGSMFLPRLYLTSR